MSSTAVNLSQTLPQLFHRRNDSPDVPEDIDDHFNDPNWDYASSPSASTTTFVENNRSSWENKSFRSSDIETSSQYASTNAASKTDLHEPALQNECVFLYPQS